jgi:hypothetical protein
MSSNKLITARKGGGMVESKESKYLWNFLFLLFGYSIPSTSNVRGSFYGGMDPTIETFFALCSFHLANGHYSQGQLWLPWWFFFFSFPSVSIIYLFELLFVP